MCRLIESIRIRDGVPRNEAYHRRRMDRSRDLLFGNAVPIDLHGAIKVPAGCGGGTFKCRIVYSREIISVEYAPYLPRAIRSLGMVASDISYDHKYEDRKSLELLSERRGSADEALIVKNGLVTDTTFSNIAFFDGAAWITPAYPLLRGTMRQKLLDEGTLREEEVRPGDIPLFRRACLINAMLDLGETEIPVENISFDVK